MAENKHNVVPLMSAKVGKALTEGDVSGYYRTIKILTDVERGIGQRLQSQQPRRHGKKRRDYRVRPAERSM